MPQSSFKTVLKISKDLSCKGDIPATYTRDLEARFKVAFSLTTRLPPQRGRKKSILNAQAIKKSARRLYRQVLDHDPHLFIPFILGVSPRQTQRLKFDDFLEFHDQCDCRVLSLGSEAKHTIEASAKRQNVQGDPDFQSFISKLFLPGQGERIIPFEGTVKEYSAYLEKMVFMVYHDRNAIDPMIRERLERAAARHEFAARDWDSRNWQGSLRMQPNLPQIIPYDSPIFIAVQNGNINDIKRILDSGESSICTTDPFGLGLLYYSTYYCWRNCGFEMALKTSHFLLQLGVSRHWRDDTLSLPVETLMDSLVVDTSIDLENNLVRTGILFGQPARDVLHDYIEARAFTYEHLKVIRQDMPCNPYYQAPSNSIDTPDSSGRSALAWAVEYGLVEKVTGLIVRGADVNQHRGSKYGYGFMPLLHLALAGPAGDASKQSYHNIAIMLLQSGANVNAVDHEGWTPLHVAASWGSWNSIDVLATYGGQPVQWDLQTHQGDTVASLLDNSECNFTPQDLIDHWGTRFSI
ncbi:hypothetical protein TruAng_012152 [Truncatella angustata]|nr:hypothetical protein TruAng_012152 [Truncatella angustata]